jgi:hypothetical protein
MYVCMLCGCAYVHAHMGWPPCVRTGKHKVHQLVVLELIVVQICEDKKKHTHVFIKFLEDPHRRPTDGIECERLRACTRINV